MYLVSYDVGEISDQTWLEESLYMKSSIKKTAFLKLVPQLLFVKERYFLSYLDKKDHFIGKSGTGIFNPQFG